MDDSKKLRGFCQEIINDCTDCGNCISECLMLQRIGEEMSSIAKREPTVEEAFSCSLCGLCEAVCPSSLSPRRMFAETRTSAVENNFIPMHEYRYMFPDRKLNVMSLYRELNEINYDDLCPEQEFAVAFFPGCSMLTYSPELTRVIYDQLTKEFKEVTLIQDCCGLPLYQLGLRERGDYFIRQVKSKLISLKVKKVIAACPNCYYQLRPILQDTSIELITVFEALGNTELFTKSSAENHKQIITIHDSCPDRFYGEFAAQARDALKRKGFTIIEMDHNQNMTMCCGSGGQVTHFQPELAERLVKNRLNEADKTGAKILAGYCLGCVLNFAKIPSELNIQHVIGILLGIELDYSGIKARSKRMFSGPEGEELWQKIMSEEEII